MRSPDHTALRFGEIRFCSPGRRVPRARASRTASSAWRTSRTRRVHNTRERWQLCSRRAGPRGVVMNRGGALSPFRPGTPARPRERSPLPLEGAVDAECPRAGGDRGSPGDSRARAARWEREGGARTMGGLLSRAHPLPRVHVACRQARLLFSDGARCRGADTAGVERRIALPPGRRGCYS